MGRKEVLLMRTEMRMTGWLMNISLWDEKATEDVRHLAGVEENLSDDRSRGERKSCC